MRTNGRGWGGAAVVILGLMLAGCGKSEAPGAGGGGKARAGYAVGRIYEEGGAPIAVPGAKVTVALWGVSSKSAEKVYYTPPVQADGTYEQKLVEGSYKYSGAQLDVLFKGEHFLLNLEPVGDDKSDRDSTKGIVQDYVWKLTGLRPRAEAKEENFTNWYGASVTMKFDGYRNDLKKSVKAPAKGTKYVFTLTPVGNLIDGKPGKELTFTRELNPLLGGLEKNGNLPDIPLGEYTVKGEEVAPEGGRKAVLMMTKYPNYGESTGVTFKGNIGGSTGAWPYNVNFTRQE